MHQGLITGDARMSFKLPESGTLSQLISALWLWPFVAMIGWRDTDEKVEKPTVTPRSPGTPSIRSPAFETRAAKIPAGENVELFLPMPHVTTNALPANATEEL